MRILLQNFQKIRQRPKTFFGMQKSKWVSKNAEFYAEYKAIRKITEKITKKSNIQKTKTMYE